MARRGDGLVLRGNTWWLDFRHQGQRHQVRIGKNISRTVARELATVERGKILRGQRRVSERKPKDTLFDKACEEFLKWTGANHRPRTVQNYRWNLDQLKKSFGGRMLSQIHPFNVEKHKQARIAEDAKVAANREISCLRNLFYRCMEWGKFEGANPAKQSKGNQAGRLTKEPLTRLRFLSQEEENLTGQCVDRTAPHGHPDWNTRRLADQKRGPNPRVGRRGLSARPDHCSSRPCQER